MRKLLTGICMVFLIGFFFPFVASAQEIKEEVLEARVVEVSKNKEITLFITKGSLESRTVVIPQDEAYLQAPVYKPGDRVLVTYTQAPGGGDLFYITDYIRRSEILGLFVLFTLVSFLVAGRKGLMSILGMGVSFAVIFYFILPQILGGANPVVATITGSLVIIPVTFYLSHGFNKKTTVAVVGTIIALTVTGVLAHMYIQIAHLSGFTSDEAGFLQVARGNSLNMQGILLAGIIIGALGALDDVTVSQSSVVNELSKGLKTNSLWELYNRAMRVGRDHIASTVNTLVLVYTGAALPLMLLFLDSSRPYLQVLNYEIVSEEIVRTLVGSIGLISAVPITTFLASFIYSNSRVDKPLKTK